MRRKYQKYQVHKSTVEDWYPTINNLLAVSALELDDGCFRVCVWGGDDTGMERDDFKSFEAAVEFTKRMVEPVTRSWLAANGFVNA